MITDQQPVMLRICAWCHKDLGAVAVAPDSPTAGKISHGICPECQAKWLAEIPASQPFPLPGGPGGTTAT